MLPIIIITAQDKTRAKLMIFFEGIFFFITSHVKQDDAIKEIITDQAEIEKFKMKRSVLITKIRNKNENKNKPRNRSLKLN